MFLMLEHINTKHTACQIFRRTVTRKLKNQKKEKRGFVPFMECLANEEPRSTVGGGAYIYAALQTQWLLNKSYTSTTNTLLIFITLEILNCFVNTANIIFTFQPLTVSSCSHSLKEAKGRHWKRNLIFHVCHFHT